MLIINLFLLLIPLFVLSAILHKRVPLWTFLPYAFLYTLNCAFFSFLILYFTNLKSGYSGRWLLFYFISILFGFIVLKLFRGWKNDHEEMKIDKMDGTIILIALSVIIISYAFWHYVNPGGTCMYYIWLDACRYWRDTGFIFPALPDNNPSNSFLVGLSYNPAIASILQLLTANVEQNNYFHAWGILVGLFHCFLLLTLVAAGYHLFNNYIVGVITFFLFFIGEWGGLNFLGINMLIGSHESATFYGAALLFLSWLFFLKEKNVFFITLFVWCALAFFSIRPYLAAFIGSLGLHMCIVLLWDRKINFKEMITHKNNVILLCLGLFLGVVPFIWQLFAFIKYGSLVVYSHSVMFASFSDYLAAGSSILDRFQTLGKLTISFLSAYLQFIIQPDLPRFRLTLMPIVVFVLFLISLLGFFFRSVQMKGQYQAWFRQLGVAFILFITISLIINVDHWKTLAAWCIILYLIAASFLIVLFNNRRTAHICSRILGILLIAYITVGGAFGAAMWPSSANYNTEKERDDGYRNKIKTHTKGLNSNIMVVRVEPGADANFEIPNKYYWNLRFFWNDCDLIIKNLKWDPTKVAYELRKNNIQWIYQPENWNMSNHAGTQTVIRLKTMLDERKDIYVPVIKEKVPGRTDLVFYEIVLPTENL